MKFEIGDRVRVIKEYDEFPPGYEGKVVCFEGRHIVGVEFNPNEIPFDLHNLNREIDNNAGYFFAESCLDFALKQDKLIELKRRLLK